MIGGVEQRLPGFDVPKQVLVDDFGAEEQVSSYRPIDLSTGRFVVDVCCEHSAGVRQVVSEKFILRYISFR